MLGHVPWKRERAFLRQITLVMGQRNQLVWDIPALDSFELNRAIYRIPASDYRRMLDELTELLEIGPLLRKPVRNLSLGERMKCEVAAALLHRPQVVFLDEPTIGLDVTMQRRIRAFIAEYNRRYGATVLLTSHYMADVEALCRRVIVIHHGRLLVRRRPLCPGAALHGAQDHRRAVGRLPERPELLWRGRILRGRACDAARAQSRDGSRHRAAAGRSASDRSDGRRPAHRRSDRAGVCAGGRVRGLVEVYVQQFKTTLASQLQYRAALVIWLIGHVLEPLIYLVVWSVVSASSGGSVGGFTTGDFAAYFILLMLVNHVTYTWIMYEYEYRVRQGALSFALLRPVHPIHADIADNVSSKLITLPGMLLIGARPGAHLPAHASISFRGRSWRHFLR